jgi:hypothetical protein
MFLSLWGLSQKTGVYINVLKETKDNKEEGKLIFFAVIGVIAYGIAFALIFSFVNSSFYFRDVRAEWGQVIDLFRASGENAAPIEVT